MINQANKGLNSRSEANPYNEDGFLPLITAPMSSVVDHTNYSEFWNNNINICFPRTADLDEVYNDVCYKDSFHALSLDDFIKKYINNKNSIGDRPHKRCIDTANGNLPELHEAIKKAKEIHGDNLIIMAGNVASMEAFVELAKTGVDYIRVGIGGGGGCNTTSNTGVGQEDLFYLVERCYERRKREQNVQKGCFEEGLSKYLTRNGVSADYHNEVFLNSSSIAKVKIVADGISSYIKQCEIKYGFNDNGYAAINKLLFAGADLVMIGKLFAQCVESAGEKRDIVSKQSLPFPRVRWEVGRNNLEVKYSGMSTQEEQKKYKLISEEERINMFLNRIDEHTADENYFIIEIGKEFIHEDVKWRITEVNLTNFVAISQFGKSTKVFPRIISDGQKKAIQAYKDLEVMAKIKPSEGSVQWLPVRWTLNEWLNGSANQDEAPYLMGWINSIKSAMSYCGKKNL